ncbi:MAG: hypothetical protein D3926_12980 [Desulfobacteraceae bacterium]|nr:MAG: hypothetical protein D3926_12980 [Desulfobacteraceae bacterium]
MKLKLFTIVVLLLILSGMVPGSGLDAFEIEPQTSAAGIQYISGGIGAGERQDLEKMMDGYNPKVVLTEGSGYYLSKCRVIILKSTSHIMVDTVTKGPWLMARLDPGRYQIKALHRGIRQGASVDVDPAGTQEVILNWNR